VCSVSVATFGRPAQPQTTGHIGCPAHWQVFGLVGAEPGPT